MPAASQRPSQLQALPRVPDATGSEESSPPTAPLPARCTPRSLPWGPREPWKCAPFSSHARLTATLQAGIATRPFEHMRNSGGLEVTVTSPGLRQDRQRLEHTWAA